MAKTRKPKDDKNTIVGNIQKQYENLFSKSDEPPALSLREVEILKARVVLLQAELEKTLTKQPGGVISSEPIPTNLEAQATAPRLSAAEKPSQEPKARMAELGAQPAGPSGTHERGVSPEQGGMRRFIIFVSLIGFVATTILTFVAIQSGDISQTVINSIGAIALVVTFVAALSGFIGFGRVVIPFIALLSIGSSAATQNGLHDPSVFAFAIVIATASLLLGQRGLIVYGVLIALSVFGINYACSLGILPGAPVALPGMIKTMVAIAATTLVLFLGTRQLEDSVQEMRRHELSQIEVNRELERIQINLADRTRDLELASEVSRVITGKVANLDEMLEAAVNGIRTRFELYYTQVYLADPSGRSIVLRAGTGEVGERLLQRGHRLLVGSGSLNGRAAAEKKTVIVTDTRQSASFMPNVLLPNTRSEMAVPLIVGDRVIGVLDMQSEQPDSLNETNLAAFEALAGQLAIAIQNAALFAQVEEARSEVEAQVSRTTKQDWRDFMNAIERGQKIGYASDQTATVVLDERALAKTPDGTTSVPIQVTGARVGELQLAGEPGRDWTSGETELVQVIATQLGEHLNNLRLLAESRRFQAEAEEATRRLTREGWDSYLLAHSAEAAGFAFDRNEVRPLHKKKKSDPSDRIQPLTVRDEVIGELAISDIGSSEEAADELIPAVAAQLSAHIENLRLSVNNMNLLKSSEERAQREQLLRQVTNALRGSTNPAAIMRTAVRELGSILGRKTVIRMTSAEEAEAAANRGDGPDSAESLASTSAAGGAE